MKILFLYLFLFFSNSVFSAGFDFGDLSKDGEGSFNQPVARKAVKRVIGTIPKGVKDLKIYLTSTKDVDVRLYDTDNRINNDNKAIVGWNIGALIGDGLPSEVKYNGVTIKYSGYNGSCPKFGGNYTVCSAGTSPGNEYILISGVTKNRFVMSAYGYDSGVAKINYSWKGVTSNANDLGGKGEFISPVKLNKRVPLDGVLPAGINNISVFLSSDGDIDIELYNAKTNEFVVGWYIKEEDKTALISSDKRIKKKYKGDTIIWSGWNGRHNITSSMDSLNVDKEKGLEYIRILGKSKNSYKMKIFGYNSGNAKVEYRWGDNMIFFASLGQTKVMDDNSNENMSLLKQYKVYSGIITNGIDNNTPMFKKDGFKKNDLEWVRKNGGLHVIAMKLSAINYGGGDISVIDSGSSYFIGKRVKMYVENSPNSKVYLVGHSSGGRSVQITSEYINPEVNIEQVFYVDAAGVGTKKYNDYTVTKNVKEAFNFYQNDEKYGLIDFLITKSLKVENNKTKIHNTLITNSSHRSIDNDSRVTDSIFNKIKTNFYFTEL